MLQWLFRVPSTNWLRRCPQGQDCTQPPPSTCPGPTHGCDARLSELAQSNRIEQPSTHQRQRGRAKPPERRGRKLPQTRSVGMPLKGTKAQTHFFCRWKFFARALVGTQAHTLTSRAQGKNRRSGEERDIQQAVAAEPNCSALRDDSRNPPSNLMQ